MPLWYDYRNDVLLCWIGLIVSRSDSVLEVQRYSMRKNTLCLWLLWIFDCWSYHVGRWTVNEAMWKTVPKLLKWYWTAETEFWFLISEVSLIFRKLISDIFFAFCTPLSWSNIYVCFMLVSLFVIYTLITSLVHLISHCQLLRFCLSNNTILVFQQLCKCKSDLWPYIWP